LGALSTPSQSTLRLLAVRKIRQHLEQGLAIDLLLALARGEIVDVG